MVESWADIKGYEGIYQVSDYGRIKNIVSGKLRKLVEDKDGYYQVKLYKNGRSTTKKVHRLVASAFIKNDQNYPLINHKDEDKKNNCYKNLEWCDKQYNNTYGSRAKPKCAREVAQFMPGSDKPIGIFKSIFSASRKCNLYASNISHCCLGDVKTAGGYYWRFV